MSTFEVYYDGSCRNLKGNPTPMGIGVVLYEVKDDGERIIIEDIACYVSYLGTSYVSEVLALNLALEIAHFHHHKGVTEVRVFGDNETTVKQFNREYIVLQRDMKQAIDEAREWAEKMGNVTVNWIGRGKNSVADRLSKLGRQMYLDEIGFDYDGI